MNTNITDAQRPKPETIIRRRGLKAATGLSPATIYRYIKEGEFPRPKKIGKQAVGWPQSWIDAWLADRPTTDRQ